MNKVSMDALNRGWSIGLGTRIYTQNPDFDYALARSDIQSDKAQKAPVTARVGSHGRVVELLVAAVVRRLAY